MGSLANTSQYMPRSVPHYLAKFRATKSYLHLGSAEEKPLRLDLGMRDHHPTVSAIRQDKSKLLILLVVIHIIEASKQKKKAQTARRKNMNTHFVFETTLIPCPKILAGNAHADW